MGSKLESAKEYIQESIQNVRDDRSMTNTLLTDLLIEMKKSPDSDTHKQLGFIASKYVETLQRSNEQLVKIASIISKRQGTAASLDEKDKKELFDIIQGTKK